MPRTQATQRDHYKPTSPGKVSSQSIDFENNQSIILTKLNKELQEFPDRFPKIISPLPPVDDNKTDQWQERLRQAKEAQTGERVSLIPYYVQDSHWIGVILKFHFSGLQCAEFIDPVVNSSFDPSKSQEQFSNTFPGVTLKSRTLKTTDDPKQSAERTVENLLTAAAEIHSADVKSLSTVNSCKKIIDDRNLGTTNSSDEQRSISTATLSQGNIEEQPDKNYPIHNKSEDSIFTGKSDSTVKVSPTEQPIVQEPNQCIYHDINGHKAHFELYEVLASQLKRSLAAHEIDNEQELQNQITTRKELILSLEKEGKHISAQRRKDSL
ncbi:unnamed protein product, partial [Rotaria socialis]